MTIREGWDSQRFFKEFSSKFAINFKMFDSEQNLIEKCNQLAEMMNSSRCCVVLTGAGISTGKITQIPRYNEEISFRNTRFPGTKRSVDAGKQEHGGRKHRLWMRPTNIRTLCIEFTGKARNHQVPDHPKRGRIARHGRIPNESNGWTPWKCFHGEVRTLLKVHWWKNNSENPNSENIFAKFQFLRSAWNQQADIVKARKQRVAEESCETPLWTGKMDCLSQITQFHSFMFG